jgi:hypothetical protein
MSRRAFVQGQATSVSPSLALEALNTRWALAQAADFGSDIDVLNYALTLEYLEAAFYKQGNAANLLDGPEKDYLATIASDEQAHVDAITATITKLGGTPVAAPAVQFGDAFADRKSYLTTSHTFENVGVGAYLGAAGFIKNKDVLAAAASIFGVEARHAALVGQLLNLPAEGGVYMGAFETPMTKDKVLSAVTPFLASQMGAMPAGGVDTGGGPSSTPNTGLLVGGAALLGAAGTAAYVARSHSDPADGPSSDGVSR